MPSITAVFKMSLKKARKSYGKAFKEEAVALATEQGYIVSKAAEVVGVSSSQINKSR